MTQKPIRNKRGTIASRTKGVFLNEVDTTQFAIEELNRRYDKLANAHNANGKALKEVQIQLNLQGMTIKRLQDRIQRSDSE